MSIIVFLGPTLSRSEARAVLPEAEFRPPARQGDVYRAARAAPGAIGLIDGAFLDVPAVWHREILWALEQGISVFGAASMGALRAAELEPFGMIGVGKIERAYRDGRYPPYDEPFEDDDEVAVVHAPEAAGGMQLSDAMVDLRETLARAESAGSIDRSLRDALVARMKRLPFRERTFSRLAEAARDMAGDQIAATLDRHRVSQKREDAVAMLTAMRKGVPAPSKAPFRMERTLVWERFVASAKERQLSTDEVLVLTELHLDEANWRALQHAAHGRLVALDRASGGDARAELDCFRRARALWGRTDLDAWLGANGIAPQDLEGLMKDEAALDATAEASSPIRLQRAVLDHLRLCGTYPSLLAQARERQRQDRS